MYSNSNLSWFKQGTDEINYLDFRRYIGAVQDEALKCSLSKLKNLAVQQSTEDQNDARA